MSSIDFALEASKIKSDKLGLYNPLPNEIASKDFFRRAIFSKSPVKSGVISLKIWLSISCIISPISTEEISNVS